MPKFQTKQDGERWTRQVDKQWLTPIQRRDYKSGAFLKCLQLVLVPAAPVNLDLGVCYEH
jgi:hypothetical protein